MFISFVICPYIKILIFIIIIIYIDIFINQLLKFFYSKITIIT